jgi:hypothetical protein
MPPTPAMTTSWGAAEPGLDGTIRNSVNIVAATPFRRRFPRGAGEVPVLRGRGFSMVSQFVQTKVKEEAPAQDSVRLGTKSNVTQLSREISFKTVQYRTKFNVDESSAVESNYFESEEVSERSRTGGEYAR